MSKWFVTVGAHGGEFAIASDDKGYASEKLRKAVREAFDNGAERAKLITVREAPRQLVDWIKAQLDPGSASVIDGGWLAGNDSSNVFIPVPMAANLTILYTPEDQPSDDAKGAEDASNE